MFRSLSLPAVALSADGPLAGSGPGDVTRWMAVPWQADTASCRSGYQYGPTPVDPYLPTFWAARFGVANAHLMSWPALMIVIAWSMT